MTIRVLIADDHPIFLKGLRALLSVGGDFEVIAEAQEGLAALAGIRALAPQVALLDVQMPGITGIEVCSRLHEEGSPTRTALLSAHTGQSFVESAMRSGATGYIVKGDRYAATLKAIHAVSRGEIYVSPTVGSGLVDALRAERPADEVKLSQRERTIVRMLSSGLSGKEIAAELDLATKTVESHRAAIMHKLRIDSVPALVKYALRTHLTELDPPERTARLRTPHSGKRARRN